jgi:hypothetical protein
MSTIEQISKAILASPWCILECWITKSTHLLLFFWNGNLLVYMQYCCHSVNGESILHPASNSWPLKAESFIATKHPIINLSLSLLEGESRLTYGIPYEAWIGKLERGVCDKIPLPIILPIHYHILTTWRSPVKDAVDSGCRIHCGLWGVKSREGAAKSVVRIHPLALKHADACSRHENTGRLKTETNIRILEFGTDITMSSWACRRI